MAVGDTYRIKYFGEWIDAILCTDPSVKEYFFREVATGDLILKSETEGIRFYKPIKETSDIL